MIQRGLLILVLLLGLASRAHAHDPGDTNPALVVSSSGTYVGQCSTLDLDSTTFTATDTGAGICTMTLSPPIIAIDGAAQSVLHAQLGGL